MISKAKSLFLQMQNAIRFRSEISMTKCAGPILACVLLIFPSTDHADDVTSPRDRVQNFIRGLDAGTLAERIRAEREILDLGPEILSKLPATETIESVSARESLRRIRVQLERRAAKESSGPSHVTLQGEFALGEILKQIEQQTGNRTNFAADDLGLSDERVMVNWERLTFWSCADDLCDRGGLQWQFANEAASVLFSNNRGKLRANRAIQRVGAFRLQIENVEIRPVIGELQEKLIRVTGRLSMEPRLRPLFLSIAAADFQATADSLRPVSTWNPDAKYEHPVRDGNHDVMVSWDFSMRDISELKLLHIRGRIHCQIAAATERVVFDQTSQTRGTIRRRGGVSVRLRDVTFTPVGSDELNAEIGVAVSYDSGGPAFESHRTWIFHNAVYLETKSGVRSNFADFDMTQQSDGAVAVDYRWQKIAAPANQYLFVYEAPTLIIDVPIDIDLEKIPVGE